jgi:hypothetical protein
MISNFRRVTENEGGEPVKIIEAGHIYQFGVGGYLSFLKRGDGSGGDITHDGTTNEKVIAALIDRMEYLDAKLPCEENKMVLIRLKQALAWLNERASVRLAQDVQGTNKPHVSN